MKNNDQLFFLCFDVFWYSFEQMIVEDVIMVEDFCNDKVSFTCTENQG